MPLTPGEDDRLHLHLQALLAGSRRARGLRLNVPEARALIADAVCEWARDGLTLVDARERARHLLGIDDVLPGVPEALTEVRVEARFDDGTRLVVVSHPFNPDRRPVPDADAAMPYDDVIAVTNEADTAIGLSSHIHLAEVNPRLRLDRRRAFGRRPAITTGSTVWIVPGETVQLPVRSIGGARVQFGTSGLVDGELDDPQARDRALALLRTCGYLDVIEGEPVGDRTAADQAIARLMAATADDK